MRVRSAPNMASVRETSIIIADGPVRRNDSSRAAYNWPSRPKVSVAWISDKAETAASSIKACRHVTIPAPADEATGLSFWPGWPGMQSFDRLSSHRVGPGSDHLCDRIAIFLQHHHMAVAANADGFQTDMIDIDTRLLQVRRRALVIRRVV